MSENRDDLSNLTGPELVRAFLDAMNKPHTSPAERAEFFDFKAKIFGAIAERDDNPDAARAAARARFARDKIRSDNLTPTDGEA